MTDISNKIHSFLQRNGFSVPSGSLSSFESTKDGKVYLFETKTVGPLVFLESNSNGEIQRFQVGDADLNPMSDGTGSIMDFNHPIFQKRRNPTARFDPISPIYPGEPDFDEFLPPF